MRFLFVTGWAFGGAVIESVLARGHDLAGIITPLRIPRPLPSLPRAVWDGPSGLNTRRSVGALAGTGPVERAAAAGGAPWIRSDDLDDPGCLEALRRLEADRILVIGWPRILGPPFLEGLGSRPINAHPSLLPHHRGANPFASVLRRGERRTGWSFHLMTDKPDAGPILLQRTLPLRADDDGLTLQIRLCRLAREIVPELLAGLERGELTARAQEGGGSLFPPVREEDRPVDWTRPAAEICNQVRALYPWAEATTTWRGRTIRFDRCRPAALRGSRGGPGRIEKVTPRGLVVAAGGGALWLGGVRLPDRSFGRSQSDRWRLFRRGESLGAP